MKRTPMPKLEQRCSLAPDYDSRGPGWYCCQCNRYNPRSTTRCRACEHGECR